MRNDGTIKTFLRGYAAVIVTTLIAAAVPFSDSPDFFLDTSSSSSSDLAYDDSPSFAADTTLALGATRFADSPSFAADTTLALGAMRFADSRDFTLDARLTAYDPDYAESNSFALDSTRINRVWGDSETFAVPPVPGDFDGDRDVDLADWAAFQGRMNGPFEDPTLGGWHLFDLDPDYDVDLRDFAVWQNAFTGP
jgi:hypothetical protein